MEVEEVTEKRDVDKGTPHGYIPSILFPRFSSGLLPDTSSVSPFPLQNPERSVRARRTAYNM
jgi:hypothetical protein